jgi:hypothetical protein
MVAKTPCYPERQPTKATSRRKGGASQQDMPSGFCVGCKALLDYSDPNYFYHYFKLSIYSVKSTC